MPKSVLSAEVFFMFFGFLMTTEFGMCATGAVSVRFAVTFGTSNQIIAGFIVSLTWSVLMMLELMDDVQVTPYLFFAWLWCNLRDLFWLLYYVSFFCSAVLTVGNTKIFSKFSYIRTAFPFRYRIFFARSKLQMVTSKLSGSFISHVYASVFTRCWYI